MEENGLRSLNNLFPLRHLKSLHLGMNRIVEVAELEKLAAHTELVEITLGNSPVARKQVRSPHRCLRCRVEVDDFEQARTWVH
jgi:hypothetical protein